MELTLHSLEVKLFKKEDKPLFSQFKLLTNNQPPVIGDRTETKVGTFKKDKAITSIKWKNEDSLFDSNQVIVEVSVDSLKSATLQIGLFPDREYAFA